MLVQPRMRVSTSTSDNRVFLYEVEGLKQNDQTENNKYPVRNSSTILLQVPYSRMNDEMRRITRLGGKIVGIRPLSENSTEATSDEAASES
ncbi:phycobilisome linker polypeptide [Anabaena sp. UHCC 0399]|uniref:phycobilisome linker polypeptide n=1 Tax=Anabaena sp. UHCC 0399 TaxID=3110238 RepID=UPI0016839006|nr:phycobilisome linker polypeptide [Anabaena sp. UHCC 0399]MBD2360747.1 phycobilisome linker polypeptide [Anabaena minutissima FACHB-250]MEA5568891.1 phycobilisome linker polypeptide [Anabaena sp. UHCC 0399]